MNKMRTQASVLFPVLLSALYLSAGSVVSCVSGIAQFVSFRLEFKEPINHSHYTQPRQARLDTDRPQRARQLPPRRRV
eukprot:COSAG06_NODE_28406_length_575_cov_0.607143_1_plen_77_part_01